LSADDDQLLAKDQVLGLRIPVGPGHRFRRNPGTDSDMTRALNPERPGH
jgi:hypothetical protein